MGMLIKDFKFHGYGFSILQLRMLAWDFRVVARLANVVVYVDGAEWCNVMPCYAIVPNEKCSNCSSPPTSKPPDGLEMMLVSFTAKAWVSKAAGPSQETHGPHARRLRSDNRAPISANDDSRNRTADPQLASRCAQPLGQARPGARPPEDPPKSLRKKSDPKLLNQKPGFWVDVKAGAQRLFWGGAAVWEATLIIHIFWNTKGSGAITFDTAFLISELWKRNDYRNIFHII